MVMIDLDICPRPATLPPKEEILGGMDKYTEVGPNRSTTCTCSMFEKVLMALVEVDIGIIPALLPPIIQVIMVDHLIFIVIFITEFDIGITAFNCLHITMG